MSDWKSVNKSDFLLELDPELWDAKDWRGSLVRELCLDLGGDERDIERCEAVSASSSSESREKFRI